MYNALLFVKRFVNESNDLRINDIDFSREKTTMFITPTKTIETGKLRKHIRASDDFVIIESVLHGMKKRFLDSVTILTTEGNLVGKFYRIRNNEYTSDAPFVSSVEAAIKEYLVFNADKEYLAKLALDQLYSEAYQEKFYNKLDTINLIGTEEAIAQLDRQTGKTTRFVDRSIQELFSRGSLHVFETASDESQLTDFICSKVERRLKNEHKHLRFKKEMKKVNGTYGGLFTLLSKVEGK